MKKTKKNKTFFTMHSPFYRIKEMNIYAGININLSLFNNSFPAIDLISIQKAMDEIEEEEEFEYDGSDEIMLEVQDLPDDDITNPYLFIPDNYNPYTGIVKYKASLPVLVNGLVLKKLNISIDDCVIE